VGRLLSFTDIPDPASCTPTRLVDVEFGDRSNPNSTPQLVAVSVEFDVFVLPAAQRLFADIQIVDVPSVSARAEPLYAPTTHLPLGQERPPVLLGTGVQVVMAVVLSVAVGASGAPVTAPSLPLAPPASTVGVAHTHASNVPAEVHV
jgi:hypothetical protein